MEKKRCQLYIKKDGDIIIHPWSFVGHLVGHMAEPFFKCSIKDKSDVIGICIINALMESKLNTNEHPSYKEIMSKFLSFSNVKTYNTLVNNSKFISVEYTGEKITLYQEENHGKYNGGIERNGKFVEINGCMNNFEPTIIGEAFFSCLSK